jgi:hypothetical protein
MNTRPHLTTAGLVLAAASFAGAASLASRPFPTLFAASHGAGGARSPQNISLVQNLAFGGLLAGPGGGSVTVTASGAVVPLGPNLQAGAPAAVQARFRLHGPARATFTLQVDPPRPQLSGPSGASLHLAECYASLQGFRGTFDAAGQAEVQLGGRLDIPAGAAPGLYRAPMMRLIMIVQGAGGGTSTYPFQVSALLRGPLLLTNTGPLDFGALLADSRPTQLRVPPTGWYPASGAGTATLFKGRPTPATFTLQGPAGASYSIQLPTSAQLNSSTSSMLVRDFTCSIPRSGQLRGKQMLFGVGATLLVKPMQPPGNYQGSFMVSVNYQ